MRERTLDEVIFVPAREPPHKPDALVASGEHRLAMVRLAVRGEPRFSVSDCEFRRPGKSYTIDTIRQLRHELGPGAKLFFIVGADSVPELPTWKDLGALVELCAFIVAARPGQPTDIAHALREHLPQPQLDAMRRLAILSTASPISSTDIRARVAAGRTIEGLVPERVLRYILDHGLYRRRSRGARKSSVTQGRSRPKL